MNRLVLLLLAAMLVATGFSAASLDRKVMIQAERQRPMEPASEVEPLRLPLSAPVQLALASAEYLQLTLNGYGADHVGVLELEVSGGPLQVIVGGNGTQPIRSTCLPATAGSEPCRVVVRLSGQTPAVVLLTPETATATIERVAFSPATAKRHAAASGAQILYGFLILLLAGPVLVWLRRWPGAEQIALIVGGLTWIGYSGLAGLAASIGFVGLGYVLVRTVSTVKARRARAMVAAVSGIALLVILLKFAAPIMAAAFANPGGFWLALPLGVSYLAIRIVDLLLAAYAGALRNFALRDYLAFMVSPHTLPAGPIQLYGDFLRGRIENYSSVDFMAGAARMGVGLCKKLLADSFLLPLVVGHMGNFLTGAGDPSRSVLIMLVANLLYIYLDFSAYCDLAIGAARAGGRRIPENFDWPLVRSGVRKYWRHWHMTLSQWVMRRVYFPAFLASHSTTLALTASMLVIGLWHAPSIPWALWALHHSLAMAAEGKLFPDNRAQPSLPLATPFGVIASSGRYLTGMVFMLGWVALGHSFTLFASPQAAIQSYVAGLTAPFLLLAGLFR